MTKRSPKSKRTHTSGVLTKVIRNLVPFLFTHRSKKSVAAKVGAEPTSTKKKSAKKSPKKTGSTSKKKSASKKSTKKSSTKKSSKKTASTSSKKTSAPSLKKKSASKKTVKKPATTIEITKKTKGAAATTEENSDALQDNVLLATEEAAEVEMSQEEGGALEVAESGEARAMDELTGSAATTSASNTVTDPRKESSKKTGFILKKDEKEDAKAIEKQLLEDEDSFLKKANVKARADTAGSDSKKSGWNAFTSRFFGKDDAPKKDKKKKPLLTEEEIKQDSFLSKVERKKQKDVVGTAIDEIEEMPEISIKAAKEEGLETIVSSGKKATEKKSGMLSVFDLRKEAKEAANRAEKEVKDIREEMLKEQDERENMKKKGVSTGGKSAETETVKEKEVEQKKVPKLQKAKKKQKSGIQRLLASVGYIGLGKERINFIQNLATMLNAGLPLIDAIKTLQSETRVKPMRKLLKKIVDQVENGVPLWHAMDNMSFFSLHAIALIRIGEEAGNLAQNVQYLAEQEEKDAALKGKVKMAMIYPAIISVLVFVIVIGLGMFVLPNLIGVLYSLNVPLPFVTRMVIQFTNFFTSYGTVAVPGFMVGMVFLLILAKFTPLKVVAQWIMFKIPGIGALAREATIARFGVILGGLLRAGVPVVEAMDSLVDVTPIVSYRKFYAKMRDRVVIGDTFSKCFANIKGSKKLLPVSVQQLIITGEKSGSLAEIVLKVSDIYDKKASSTAEKLPLILEPMLMIFMGGLVGTIAFAILIPIYSIVGTVGR